MTPRPSARAGSNGQTRLAASPPMTTLDGRPNQILAKLPAAEFARFMEHAEQIDCPVRETLFEPQTEIERVFFPLTAMTSLVVVLSDGTTVEAMTVGREGFAGFPILNEVPTARFRGICQ